MSSEMPKTLNIKLRASSGNRKYSETAQRQKLEIAHKQVQIVGGDGRLMQKSKGSWV